MWFVYIAKCLDGNLYTGITTNVERRINEHNKGNNVGAKYTRARLPVALVYCEQHETRSEALKREADIKRLSRKEKEALIPGR